MERRLDRTVRAIVVAGVSVFGPSLGANLAVPGSSAGRGVQTIDPAAITAEPYQTWFGGLTNQRDGFVPSHHRRDRAPTRSALGNLGVVAGSTL